MSIKEEKNSALAQLSQIWFKGFHGSYQLSSIFLHDFTFEIGTSITGTQHISVPKYILQFLKKTEKNDNNNTNNGMIHYNLRNDNIFELSDK